MAERQVIDVPDFMTVRELAELIEASPIEVMKQLIANGIMASINQQVDYDTAAIIIEEMGYQARPLREVEEAKRQAELEAKRPEWKRTLYVDEDESKLQRRPPVVAVLGHVDHGKTSLLDAIRETQVAEGEAGGITQSIGAYQVDHSGQKITFIDTPGHEAFTAMRARGAQGADIAILVVAADDGVMPTTREAINHAQAAGVPIVVALNKIDKANANPDLVKQELSEVGLVPDEWDGETLVVPVSATQKMGLEDLLEAIVVVAEDTRIVANPESSAAGVVIESSTETGRGPLATLLIQNGTLRQGDVIVCGNTYGRIKALNDEFGNRIKEAGPSTPVEIMGLDEPPEPGDRFEVVDDIKEARAIAEERLEESQDVASGAPTGMSLEEFFHSFQQGKSKELLLIVKTDVQGSLEPVVASLEELTSDEVEVRILHADVGDIGENDVNLATASNAIIIGFNVDVDNAAARLANNEGIDIRIYNIIYKMIEDIELAMKGMLDPVYEEKVIGVAEVRQVFHISRVGAVAGCYIRDGVARRNARAHVLRDSQRIAEARSVSSLKRFDEDVREVRTGYECGIGLDGFNNFQEGDLIQFVIEERVS